MFVPQSQAPKLQHPLRRLTLWLGTGYHLIGLIFSFIIAVGLAGYSFINPDQSSQMRSSISGFQLPFLEFNTWLSDQVKTVRMFFYDTVNLYSENANLRQENKTLNKWQHLALKLQSENQSLKNQLNLSEPDSGTFLRARVLTAPQNPLQQSILISAGIKDGIEKGQPIISEDGVVGRIIEVGHKTSRVLLLVDMNSRIPVQIEETRQHAILAGNDGYMLDLVFFEQDNVLRKGQRVVTSGKGGVFPPGILVGTVQAVDERTLRASIKPAVKWYQLDYVRVLHKPTQDVQLR